MKKQELYCSPCGKMREFEYVGELNDFKLYRCPHCHFKQSLAKERPTRKFESAPMRGGAYGMPYQGKRKVR